MNKITKLFTLVIICFMTQSCAKVFYSPQAFTKAKAHEVLAILPPTVSIAAKRKTDAAALKDEAGGLDVLNYAWVWLFGGVPMG